MKTLLYHIQRYSLLVLAISFSSVSIAAASLDSSMAPMLQKVLPAVVNVRAQFKVTDPRTMRELQKQQQQRQHENQDNNNESDIPSSYVSIASGVIVNADNGYILTNAHVVNDAQTVTITLSDGRHYTAKIIGADKPSDIALLQIKTKNLVAIPLGDSNKMKVGDFVAAIGNPFGLNQTVTSGIVSALGRTTLGIETYENFIQTDTPINPGNSGGALISMQGELMGINTAILAPDRGNIGIGFAIPINMAKSIMQQLIQYGDIQRGILGVGAQNITPELATAFNIDTTQGALVTLVLPNSPAEQAGMQVGDIIIAVNDSNIKNASDVVNTVGFLRVNSKVNLSMLRNNKHIKISTTITIPKNDKKLSQKQTLSCMA